MSKNQIVSKNILIILPYGDLNPEEKRSWQLETILENFKNHMKNYPKCNFFIMISEQIQPIKYFNRGMLINIGFHYFQKNIGTPTHIILHDIDMLPDDKLFEQYLQTHQSLSLLPNTSKVYKETYGFKLTTGSAIYMTTPQVFLLVNGFPNNFWGWGGEDNALNARYKKNHIKLQYNTIGDFVSTDIQRKSNKDKMDYVKKKKIRNNCVWELSAQSKRSWKTNGVNQLQNSSYKIIEEKIDKYDDNITIIRIKLQLNTKNIVCYNN